MNRGLIKEKSAKTLERSWRMNIHNRFKVEVIDAKTGEVKQQARAFNVICKGLWSQLLDGYFEYIGYGSGTGTPSEDDTTLFSFIASVSASTVSNSHSVDIANGVCSLTKYITLDETTAIGKTLTEVGIYPGSSNNLLCTHAMLEDMNGNPISITKTATDIINIYATVFAHWNPSGENGVYLMPPTRDGTYRNLLDAAVGNGYRDYYNSYGSIRASTIRAGVGTAHSVSSFGARVPANALEDRKVRIVFTRASVGNLNGPGGIGFIWLQWEGSYRSVNPFFLVDVRGRYEITGETVATGDGTTTNFSTKFDFPVEATVYVDGIAQTSGVTVKPHPTRQDPFDYLLSIWPELHDGKLCLRAGGNWESVIESYLYNPLWEFGIYSISSESSYARIAFSDDLINWSEDYSASTVPQEYRNSRYLRVKNSLSGPSSSKEFSLSTLTGTFPSAISTKNIVFDTPPAAGSVITVDYVTPFVPKDENHVYDLSFEVQFGEYSG